MRGRFFFAVTVRKDSEYTTVQKRGLAKIAKRDGIATMGELVSETRCELSYRFEMKFLYN